MRVTSCEVFTFVDVYERLLTQRSDGVLLGRPDGSILRANAAACRMLGRTEAEICHVGLAGLIAPGSRRDLGRGCDGDGSLHREVLLIKADRSPFPAEVAVSTASLADGGAISLTTFRDISERRRVDAKLHASEERLRLFAAVEAQLATERRYRDLIQMSPDAVIVNRDGRIEFANPAALELFGAPAPDDLIGRPVLEVFDPEYHAAIRDRIERLDRGDTVTPLREKIVRLDRERRDVDVAAAPFDDAGRRAIQVVLRDVTQELRPRQALFESEKMESIRRFAGCVAHDFNNLLTVILSCAAELREGLSGGDLELQEDAREIEEAACRARDLTRQLLAFARRQVIAPVAVDTGEVVRRPRASGAR